MYGIMRGQAGASNNMSLLEAYKIMWSKIIKMRIICIFLLKKINWLKKTAIFSVISCAREVFVTFFINFGQKSFRIWFQIGSNVFGQGKKIHFKRSIFADNQKLVTNVFLKCNLWPLPKKLDPIWNHILKDFCLKFMKKVTKTSLAQQMTEKIAVEVDEKICLGKKCKNRPFDHFQKSLTKSETIFWKIFVWILWK